MVHRKCVTWAVLWVLLSAACATAQTGQGSLVFMGSMSFSSSSSSGHSITAFQLSPRAYLCMADQVAVGGRLSFENVSDGSSVSDLLIGPDIQYFFPTQSEDLLPFVGAGIFLVHSSVGSGSSSTGFAVAAHGGAAYLLKPNLGIYPELEVRLESRDGDTTTDVMLGVGLAGFLY
jgi:hypothetical protein